MKALPAVAQGNQPTKIEGAGAWIYLDNTNLGITGANAATILAASEISLKVSAPAGSTYAAYATGGAAEIKILEKEGSPRFDDYGTNTVRFFIEMNSGLPNDTDVTHEFTIKLVIGEENYAGVVTFTGNALVTE